MIELIKKDLLVSLKIKSMKVAVITFIVGLVILSAYSYIYPTILPIMITYIVVMNSFYYDDLNNSENYILGLPYKREEVVYSKYILVILVLVISNILMYILFGINILNSARIMVFQDVAINTAVTLFSLGIILPMIFQGGYKKIRLIAPIGVVIVFIIISKIGTSIVEFFDSNYNTNISIAFIGFIIINLLLYIFSMKSSLSVFTKKDIG